MLVFVSLIPDVKIERVEKTAHMGICWGEAKPATDKGSDLVVLSAT